MELFYKSAQGLACPVRSYLHYMQIDWSNKLQKMIEGRSRGRSLEVDLLCKTCTFVLHCTWFSSSSGTLTQTKKVICNSCSVYMKAKEKKKKRKKHTKKNTKKPPPVWPPLQIQPFYQTQINITEGHPLNFTEINWNPLILCKRHCNLLSQNGVSTRSLANIMQ